jgi:transcription factor E
MVTKSRSKKARKTSNAPRKRLSTKIKKAIKKKAPIKKVIKNTKKKVIKNTRRVVKAKPVKKKLRVKKRVKAKEPKVLEIPKKKYPLKHLYSFVHSVAGTEGLKVVKSMGDGATDEFIGEQTELKVSEIRHLLNQLHSHGIVEYSREKNMTTGWFTYTWKFNMDRTMKNLLIVKAKKKREVLNALLEEKTTQFYSCRDTCTRFCFDDAVDLKFRCECGKKLYYQDNAEHVKEMKEELNSINTVLELTPP